MAGRLKRRSSIGLTGRRDSMPGPGTPGTPEMFTQDDDEERRARNQQRRQAKNLETGMSTTESPGMDRQGSSTGSRRSIGGISGLSAAQLAEHYNNCIKLSAENKISTKNAFNLQLIDYMATMIKKNQSDMNNFQVAAGTLDASTKIYAYRVDSVYGDTLKIAGGLGQAGKQDRAEADGDGEEAAEDGDAANPDQPKKKRRLKKSSTVEKNLKNINVNKFELEFDVDPLFKKTSSQFDSGAGGNQFLATLQVQDDTCELLLDSDKTLERVNTGTTPVKQSPFGVHSELSGLLDFDRLGSSAICETFEAFSFNKWSLEREGEVEDDYFNRLNVSITASQDERNASRMEGNENAFDAFAVPEPIDDDGMVDLDHDHDGMDDMERTEWSERALGHAAAPQPQGFTASLPMTTADMLSVLTTAPLEYSYFDHGKLGAWAGPKHWKFKPMSKNAAGEGEKSKGKKKTKELSQINYDSYEGNFSDNEEAKELMDKVKSFMTTPKKSVKLVEKTMKGWNREKNTLPEDLHYSGHELVRLKTVDRMIIQNKANTDQQTRVEVEDYNYENAADREEYCPDTGDDHDAYGDTMDDHPENADTMTQTVLEQESGDQEVPDLSTMSGELYTGDNLVAAPKLVDKAALQIGYAKTAKKVDMKRLKVVAWSILSQASNEEKENRSASPEKQVDKEREGEAEGTQFSTLYKTLKQPNKIGKTMSDNLSVPLAFIALLHLCNEENLSLTPSEDMDDFSISMPSRLN